MSWAPLSLLSLSTNYKESLELPLELCGYFIQVNEAELVRKKWPVTDSACGVLARRNAPSVRDWSPWRTRGSFVKEHVYLNDAKNLGSTHSGIKSGSEEVTC